MFLSTQTETLETLWAYVFLVLSIFPPTKETHFKVNSNYARATFFDVFSLSLLQTLNRYLFISKEHKQNGHFPDDYSYIFRFMTSHNCFDEILVNNLMRGKVASNEISLLYARQGITWKECQNNSNALLYFSSAKLYSTNHHAKLI